MEKQINLTCKRSERTIEYLSFGEPRTFVQKGYEVYNSNKPICFISKDDSIGEWNANSFYKFENCEGLAGGKTKKEVLENIERLLREGTFYLTWNERNYINDSKNYAKEVTELEVTGLEVSEKETKSDEVWKLFNELDDDGLVYTKHYDEALCQKQNVQYHWDEDLTVEDIETVIEYFKTLKQLIKLERKVNKLAIFG
jgi:hypothetical protein